MCRYEIEKNIVKSANKELYLTQRLDNQMNLLHNRDTCLITNHVFFRLYDKD